MKRTIFFTAGMLAITACLAQAQSFKNEISTSPFSPLFHNVQLIYERQIDSVISIGLQGKYYYAAPPSDYDSIENNGGDVTFFTKYKSRKKPGGIYLLLGAIVGRYNISAGYGEVAQGWLGDVHHISDVESRTFFTFGGKLMLGYKVMIHHFFMDFSTGAKFLVLPAKVTAPVRGNELVNAWSKYSWTGFPSPGCIFSLGITAGYRF